MISRFPYLRRYAGVLVAAVALAAVPLTAAHARVVFTFGFPFFAPVYPVYPYYAPPPVYVPPVVYAPPGGPVPGPYGASPTRCIADNYVCPSDQPRPIGSACSCPTGRAPIPGRIG